MITSNIQEILLKNNLYNNNTQIKNEPFIDTLAQTSSELNFDDITYENILSLSLEQIETIEDEDKKSLLKNLKLATMFSQDKNLSKAMYDSVLGKPFDLGYNYLYNMYEDKDLFFSSYKKPNFSSLLTDIVSNRYDDGDKKITDKISQIKLNEILTVVNSFSFLDAFSSGYKDGYDKYKDENQYGFLYNDYYLQYQELMYKYQNNKNEELNILNNFR